MNTITKEPVLSKMGLKHLMTYEENKCAHNSPGAILNIFDPLLHGMGNPPIGDAFEDRLHILYGIVTADMLASVRTMWDTAKLHEPAMVALQSTQSRKRLTLAIMYSSQEMRQCMTLHYSSYLSLDLLLPALNVKPWLGLLYPDYGALLDVNTTNYPELHAWAAQISQDMTVAAMASNVLHQANPNPKKYTTCAVLASLLPEWAYSVKVKPRLARRRINLGSETVKVIEGLLDKARLVDARKDDTGRFDLRNLWFNATFDHMQP